jgi:SSS family solute:Na+ symporter
MPMRPAFGTLFTGDFFANLFLLVHQQYVIQRTLGARSLAKGKRACCSQFLQDRWPFMMMIPPA